MVKRYFSVLTKKILNYQNWIETHNINTVGSIGQWLLSKQVAILLR